MMAVVRDGFFCEAERDTMGVGAQGVCVELQEGFVSLGHREGWLTFAAVTRSRDDGGCGGDVTSSSSGVLPLPPRGDGDGGGGSRDER